MVHSNLCGFYHNNKTLHYAPLRPFLPGALALLSLLISTCFCQALLLLLEATVTTTLPLPQAHSHPEA